ncbi:MAG: GTPase ObgE [Candidatus Levybacteria bacterium]|nr:GTPase ObgE [Candidatus Levybacteria bacterium]
MLVDEVKIIVKAGNGGNGSVHFRRNAQTPKGGPDGGNGGNGGNVYLIGVSDVNALAEFRYKKIIKAEDGVAGGRQDMHGRNGKDLIISIPVGTRVTVEETGIVYEIDASKEPLLIAKGGKGGLGNTTFKTATNQTPQYAESGEVGEQRTIIFELRLIADIGLIGLPNAGKSSLLSLLTNARPKIGNYPFTTLEPNLGVMPVRQSFAQANADGQNIVLADIPGLIEGASVGKGLGAKFLKHVEKTHVLLHCIDSTTEDVKKAYASVRKELEAYSEALQQKKEIVLLTKADLVTEKEKQKKMTQLGSLKKEILSVSVYDQKSIDALSTKLQHYRK